MKATGILPYLVAACTVFTGVQSVYAAEQAWQVTAKAWSASGERNWDEVVRLADRAEQRWGAKARSLNDGLGSYPTGAAAKQVANLNELAVITMLKGDALLAMGNKPGALAAYKQVATDYRYGQCWDKKGWWWQPAKAVAMKITKLEAEGVKPSPSATSSLAAVAATGKAPAASSGNGQSWQVVGKMWDAVGRNDYEEAVRLADLAEKRWGANAKATNRTLRSYPKGDAVKQYSVLNDLATITMLKGDVLRRKGDRQGAIAVYRKLVSDYRYGQCWDKKGWWWGPAGAAADHLSKLDPSSQEEITVACKPLPAELKLPGKKGICLTMREPAHKKGGTWEENLPRLKAVNPYWSYSWGSELPSVQPMEVEFLPMAWGAWSESGLTDALEKHVIPQIKAGKVKRFLGFNEPDKREQANMNYKAALKYWPLLEKLNVPLCSPACANPEGVDDDTVQGVSGTWMRDFMTEADKRGYRVDYTGVHWYGGTGARSFKEKLVRIYEKYGRRPLLITEFSPADWRAKNVSDNDHSPEAVLEFMKEMLPWMEKQDWIAGYAWFSFGQHEPQGTSSALFDKDGNLTACGRYYASITKENPDGDQSIQPDPSHRSGR